MGRLLKQWRNRLLSLFRDGEKQRELELEMQYHLEALRKEYIQNGMTPERAHRAALARFGGAESLKEECRDAWGTRVVMDLIRDIRYSMRVLSKSRAFSLAVIATLALCIGGNASIFTMLNTLLLKPLPFPESERIVEIYNTYPEVGVTKDESNVPMYLDFKEHVEACSDFGLIEAFSGNIGVDGYVERVNGFAVTSGFFQVLRVRPHIGAFFSEENMVRGQHRVVVFSFNYWQDRYASDPSISGQTVMINEHRFEVRGVAPRSLEALYPNAQIFVAYAWNPANVDPLERHSNDPKLLARLKEGVDLSVAKSQIDARDEEFSKNHAQLRGVLESAGHETKIVALQEERVESVRNVLYLLQVCGLFVWLIGCVNISNLALTRANARNWEFALRRALGGRMSDIGRQLFSEGLLLSLAGAGVGVLFGLLGIRLINTYAMDILPPMPPLAFGEGSLGFMVVMAILTGLIISFLPTVRLFSRNLIKGLSESSRGSSTNRGSQRISSALVCGQLSLALVLLVGAGLLIHSFYNIVTRDYGLDATNVTTLRIPLLGQRYQDNVKVVQFQDRIREIVSAMPGVESVGIGRDVPMYSDYSSGAIQYSGSKMDPNGKPPLAFNTRVSPGYFEALGIKLLRGEVFGPLDVAGSRRGVVIDEKMADLYFNGESPIGRKLVNDFLDPNEEHWPEIIGVVEFAQHERIDDERGYPFAYYSIYDGIQRSFSLFIRSDIGSDLLVAEVRKRLGELDSKLPVFLSGPLIDFVDESLNNRRVIMYLLTIFAVIAMLLSSIGIYGVMAYSVSRQRREIGTRAAIGATRGEIVKLFFKRALRKTAIGLGLGLVGALTLSRFLAAMLYEVESTDFLVYTLITVVLFLVSLLASYLPAMKASRIHPMETLRLD